VELLLAGVEELTRLPVPAPVNGHTDSAIAAVDLALMAVSHDLPDGQVLPVEELRARAREVARTDGGARLGAENRAGGAVTQAEMCALAVAADRPDLGSGQRGAGRHPARFSGACPRQSDADLSGAEWKRKLHRWFTRNRVHPHFASQLPA
jgi:hypothetical protein